MNKEQAIVHMQNGGQVFRNVDGDRFFYKIFDGKMFCRVNGLGGWNPPVRELRETDELHVAEFDYSYDYTPPDKVIRMPLPLPQL